ncbi:MAG: hypothetical protein H6747_01755 [Deltaproteobacteria bacterium]|nr:hypothetical protein [Deltaproteobacteria bacterium]
MTSVHRSPRERRRAAAAPGAPPWLIAADADEAGGSVLSLAGVAPTAAERVGFGAAAQAAWRDAHRAAATGLPLRWRSLDGLSTPPAWARRVDRRRMPGAAAKAVAEVVDGPSFGLGFFLTIACRAAELSARADVVALAALTAEGTLRPVGGLRAKLWLVGQALPQARIVLVASAQQAEAEAIALELRASGALSADCAVVGLRDASEAIAVALGGTADAAIRDAALDPARRHEWIAALCHLALDGHDRISHWPPIAAATTAACEAFAPARSDPIDDDYALLQIADVVAHRHATEPRRWPSLDLLQRLPLPRRLMVLAHATQHAADVGDPEPAVLQPYLDAHLARDPDAFEVHCRVAGAWGRLLAARGQPEQALAWQRFAARQRLAIGAPQGMSHPLAEWLRLAGLLGDAAAVEEARALRARAEALGAVGSRDRPFLALADARADLGLGRDGADARLAAVMDDLDAPLHVRHSAARLLAVTATTTAARRAAAEAALAEPHREPVARLFAALARLDAVVLGAAQHADALASDASAIAMAIATLQVALPGPLHHLRVSLPDDADDAALAAAISRHFPY